MSLCKSFTADLAKQREGVAVPFFRSVICDGGFSSINKWRDTMYQSTLMIKLFKPDRSIGNDFSFPLSGQHFHSPLLKSRGTLERKDGPTAYYIWIQGISLYFAATQYISHRPRNASIKTEAQNLTSNLTSYWSQHLNFFKDLRGYFSVS